MRRTTIALLGVLLLTVSVTAAGVPFVPSSIIPSKAIGPFQLGMTPVQFTGARRTAPCSDNVQAVFEQRKAIRLETNCGGAYRTETRITVGMDPSLMLRIFGTPDRVVSSNISGVRGEWLQYTRFGIAFRIVYGDVGYGLIQAIAVFRGTAPGQAPKDPFTPDGPPGAPPSVD